MGEIRLVSSDPGSYFLGGLDAELEAALCVVSAWKESASRLEDGLKRWEREPGEQAGRNAVRYRESLARVTEKAHEARQRAEAARAAIREQQRRNREDWRQRRAEQEKGGSGT